MSSNAEVIQLAAKTRLLLMAVDGVLTDGKLYNVPAPDGSMAETLIAENPRVDIDDVIRFGEAQKVIGYTYTEEQQKSVYFDSEFKSLADSLSKALP